MSAPEEKEINIVSDPENSIESSYSSPDTKDTEDYETIYMVTHHVVHHRLEIPVSHTPPNLFQRILRRIGNIYRKLTGKAQIAEDAIQDTFHTITDEIPHVIGGAKDTIDSTAEEIAGAAREKITNAKDSVADAIHSVQDTVHSQYEHAKEGISDAVHSAEETAKEQVENIKEKAHQGVEKTKNALHNAERKAEHISGRVKQAVFSPWNYAKEHIFHAAKEKVGETAASIEESIADRLNESRDNVDWWTTQAQQKAHGYFENGQEWMPTKQTVGDIIQQVARSRELGQQIGYNVPASAFYTALFVLYFILLRKKLWHQRQRTNVYYGDASVELARSPSLVEHDSMEETSLQETNDERQVKMHVASSKITTTTNQNHQKGRDGDQVSSRNILHPSSTVFQAPSQNDYFLLMKLVEACNVYAITVPISILTLAIMEMNGINGYILHTLYLIFGYCTYLYIHGGLLSDTEDFALGKRAAAHEIGLTVLAIAGITCVVVYVGSLL